MNRYEDWVETYARGIVRHRWPIVALMVAVWITASYGAMFLKVNDDYRVFFRPNDLELVAYTKLQNTFTKNEYIVFAVAPDGGEVFIPGVLDAIGHLTQEAWRLPYARRVDSLTNYPYSHADGDELVVEDLVSNPGSMSQEELERVKRVALSQDEILHSLLSPNAHVAGVIVTYQLPDVARVEGTEAALAARTLASRIEAEHPGISIRLTGSLMLNNAFREAAENDITTLVPLMYAGIVVVLFIFLRSISATFAAVSVVALSVSTSMGLAGWLGFDITATSASAPTIIMTLAIADSVHILMALRDEMRRGLSKSDALIGSLHSNTFPVFLTSLTTFIGFVTINFSESPPFRDLGNMCALGIAAAYLYSILFLPALICVLPMRVQPRSRPPLALMEWVAEHVLRRRRWLLPASMAAIAALAAAIPLNELNDHYTMYFDESNGFRQDIEFTTANLTGMYPIEFALGSGEDGGIASPAYLHTLDEFAQWFRAQPNVIHVSSFSDVMKRINMNMHGDDPEMYRVPDSRELAAQYLLLYQMSLPFGLDLNDRIDVRESATRFIVTVGGVTANEVGQTADNGEQWLAKNAPPCMFSHGMGPSVLFSRIAWRDTRHMLAGMTVELVLISAILILFLRSVKIGLLSLIPNLVPAAVAFGIWGLLVGRVGLGLSAVMAVTLGIVVDDTIHFLSKYQLARRQHGLAPEEAVRYSFSSVGNVVIATSAILAGGFMVLSLSSFEVNAAMGRLSTLVILLALAVELMMLPCLLVAFDRTIVSRGGKES
ncbi:MAG: MMPL family transporter [Candidatus Hydrogenedentes bacterium]|nr:MMPL family transporter [Candidatus Hydrogenedentota bacterium]